MSRNAGLKGTDIVLIEGVKRETHDTVSLRFSRDDGAKPGQFYMIWVPGVDEIPMSISRIDGDRRSITVKEVGEATRALCSMKTGDKIGVRGPFGNGYSLRGKKILLVGGGSGMASLIALAEKYNEMKREVTLCIGGRTEKDILFKERGEAACRVEIATDDGSMGYHGFVTDLTERILDSEKGYELVVACGPEIMMKKVLETSLKKGIAFEASLERLMKCGVGICDSCSIKGYRVCRDGPVFPAELLIEMDN